MRQVTFHASFSGWQMAARRALKAAWLPGEILWQESTGVQPLLEIGDEAESADTPSTPVKVPKAFVEMARRVACHSDPSRWGLLYQVLWRLTHGEKHVLQIVVDPAIRKLHQMDKAIRRDVHKMRAFVRFRAVEHEGVTRYAAWFEPQHHIVELNAPFFVDRFANMHWSILTPDICAHWDQTHLIFTEGVTRADAPTSDATEGLWIRYYSNIFNPSRVKTHAMQAEMPKKYWKNLPETAVIPALLNDAPRRMAAMIAGSREKSARKFQPALVPKTNDLHDAQTAPRAPNLEE